jgi:hypothetical protein
MARHADMMNQKFVNGANDGVVKKAKAMRWRVTIG